MPVQKNKAASKTLPYQAKNYLLAIAINDYDNHDPDKGINDLQNCILDAENLIDKLTTDYEFEPEQVHFLYSGTLSPNFQKEHPNIQYTPEAKESTILNEIRAIAHLINQTPTEDDQLKANLIVYFSGHGEVDDLLDAGYWIPSDAILEDYSTYIPNSTIRDFLKSIKSHHTLLLVDSCFSGSLLQSAEASTKSLSNKHLEETPSRHCITATRLQLASDGKGGQGSPFSRGILQTLTTGSEILVQDLYKGINEYVVIQSKDLQQPAWGPIVLAEHQAGQFVFRKKANARKHFEAGLLLMELAYFQPEYERFRSAANQFALALRLTKNDEEKGAYAWWEARALCAAGALEIAAETLEGTLEVLKSQKWGNRLRAQLAYAGLMRAQQQKKVVANLQEKTATMANALATFNQALGQPESSDFASKMQETLASVDQAQADRWKKAIATLQQLAESAKEKDTPALINWILITPDDPKLLESAVVVLDFLHGPVKYQPAEQLSKQAETLEALKIAFSPVECLQLARRFSLFGAFKEAATFYERSGLVQSTRKKLPGNFEEAHLERWAIHLNLALCYLELDALEPAVDQLNKCLAIKALKSKAEVFLAVQRLHAKVKEALKHYHLLIQTDPYLKSKHSQRSLAEACSPDGQYILSASLEDNTASLRDIDSGKEIVKLKGHTAKVVAVAFSPDGQLLLTGAEDNTAKSWNQEGVAIRTFKGHAGPIAAVAFLPDGKRLLTGSDDKTAKLWSIDGDALLTLNHTAPVAVAAFSPDGQYILTGVADNTAQLWKQSGESLQTFQNFPETDRILSLAFSPDGQQILAGCAENNAKLWKLENSKINSPKVFQDVSAVVAVAFSKNGQYIVTGTDNNTGKLWDTPTNESLIAIESGHIQLNLVESENLLKALLEDIRAQLQEHLENGNEDLRVDLGVILNLLGQPDQAIAELSAAEAAQDKDAHYLLGRILLEQKLARAAEYEAELEAQPVEDELNLEWDNKPSNQPSWTAVANQLREAISHDPKNAPAFYYLGKAILGLVEDESLKTAVEFYNKYLEAGAPIGHQEEVQQFINSQDKKLQKEAAIKRGKEALAADKIEESIDAFEEAIRLGDQASYYHLGRALEKNNDAIRSVEAYRQAIKAKVHEPDLKIRFGYAVNALFGDLNLLKEGINALSDATTYKDKRERKRLAEFTNTIAGYAIGSKRWVQLNMGEAVNEQLKVAWDYSGGALWMDKDNVQQKADLEIAPLEEGTGYLIRDLSGQRVLIRRKASADELVQLAIRELQSIVSPVRYDVMLENGRWLVHCGVVDGLPLQPGQPVQADVFILDRPQVPGLKATIQDIGFHKSTIQLQDGDELDDVAWYGAVLYFLPRPPIRVWVHGDPKSTASIRQICNDLNKNIQTVDQPSLSEAVQLEIEAAEDGVIIRDRENNQQSLETNSGTVAETLRKIINWKRTLQLANSQSTIQQWINLEMQVMDKNRKLVIYSGEELALQATPDRFMEKDGALFAGFVPQVKVMGAGQDLYCYLFHLRSNYSIESYEGEVRFYSDEYAEKEAAVLPLWKKPKGWGLSPDEKEACTYFLLLACTEPLDYHQMLQSGLAPTRSAALEWKPLMVSGDWCAKLMKVQLERGG